MSYNKYKVDFSTMSKCKLNPQSTLCVLKDCLVLVLGYYHNNHSLKQGLSTCGMRTPRPPLNPIYMLITQKWVVGGTTTFIFYKGYSV